MLTTPIENYRWNLSIPGWKDRTELKSAIDLVRDLPQGSTIVEVGACAGRVTWHIARNAPPGCRVIAVDLWDHDLMFVGRGYRLDSTQENTLEYFQRYTADCENIQPLRGNSLTVPWDEPIELALVDPDLGRGNSDDILEHFKRWMGFLKPGHFIAGFNYFPKRPDVCAAVEQLGQIMRSPVLRDQESFWKIQKL